MTPYLNASGSSPIDAYEIATDSITIRFRPTRRRRAKTYLYTLESTGLVNSLIELAVTGSGLATFISKHKPRYARRW